MKHYSLKSVLVIAAFLIGVSINNSCGESPIDNDLSSMYTSIRTLQNEVANLKQEIKRSDLEIATLKSTGGGSQGDTSSGEIYIDGLYFGRNGMVSSKIKKMRNDDSDYTYIYDNQGRLVEQESKGHQLNAATSKLIYEYSGKTSVVTTTITSDTYQSTSQITYEYY